MRRIAFGMLSVLVLGAACGNDTTSGDGPSRDGGAGGAMGTGGARPGSAGRPGVGGAAGHAGTGTGGADGGTDASSPSCDDWTDDGGAANGDGSAGSPAGGAGGAASAGAPAPRFELEARDLTLSVDDAGSTGGDGAIATYSWDYGDGATATDRTPRVHEYTAPGTYTVALTVTNVNGKRASTTETVTVAARHAGEYAPDDATTGVPDIVKDRLFVVDLEKAGKSSSSTPTTAEETLYVTKTGANWALARNMNTAVTLPAENAYVEGDRFVLDRVHVRGYIDVRAANVTLRRSIVEGVSIPDAPALAAPGGIDVGRRLVRGNNAGAAALRLEDVEITVPASVQRGGGINASYHHGLGLEASRLLLLRSEISGTVDGMQVHQGAGTYTDVTIERSFIHDMQFYDIDAERTDGDSTHSDGIQVECSLPKTGELFGVRLLGNTLDLTSDPNLNAPLMVTKNACATSGLLVTDNFMDGAVFAINIGGGTAAAHITYYANGNRFGPNRASGTKPNKTFTTSTTAKVIATKANTDGSAAYENYASGGTQQWTYFSYDPPGSAGEGPPTGEANRNVMVDHARGAATWGTTSRGAAAIGLY